MYIFIYIYNKCVYKKPLYQNKKTKLKQYL